MKIRLLSDLHTEFDMPYRSRAFNEYRGEDVLVLAGDVSSGVSGVMEVLEHFANIFPHVVYVPGNHEYYGASFRDFNEEVQERCAQYPNIHLLRRNSVTIDGVCFIGATLWTNFGGNPLSKMQAQYRISDFRLIKGFGPEDAEEQYRLDYRYLKDKCETYRGPKVVVTHFLPARECISPRFRDDESGLNNYFANDLGDWISELRNTTWLFGHTHDVVDITLGTTRLVANPHGYWGCSTEGQDFDHFKTITL